MILTFSYWSQKLGLSVQVLINLCFSKRQLVKWDRWHELNSHLKQPKPRELEFSSSSENEETDLARLVKITDLRKPECKCWGHN